MIPQSHDIDRRHALRSMKRRATGLLVVVTIVFVVARAVEHDHSALGYVRATAEAAMVGALADWFAVTALFKHPLGLPIPHTAIIPTRKDQIGESLGDFVQENFLSPEVVAEKLRSASIAHRVAMWLGEDDHARSLSANLAVAVAGIADVLRDEEVQDALEHAVVSRVRATPVAPLVGRVLDVMTANDRHQQLFDAAIRNVVQLLEERRETFRGKFAHESPWWVPEPIDERIFEKIFNGVRGLLGDMLNDPRHEVRLHFDERVRNLVIDLKSSPELQAKGEELKEEMLAHPAVRAWTASLWSDMKASLVRQSTDPDSELRRRIERAVTQLARTLRDDPSLEAKVDRWVEQVVIYVVGQYRHEIAELISSTVRKWDAAETSERIELQIGKDLQFIRINGTVVGGLVGLVIYAIGQHLV